VRLKARKHSESTGGDLRSQVIVLVYRSKLPHPRMAVARRALTDSLARLIISACFATAVRRRRTPPSV
jgi:hypothetical protein